MKSKNKEPNSIDGRMDSTVDVSMALSCVFCDLAFRLCREWADAGFDPADTILIQNSVDITDGIDGQFRPTVNMAVSALLYFGAYKCYSSEGTKKALIDPHNGEFDPGRLLEKLFDKVIVEHKTPYSIARIAENSRLIRYIDGVSQGSVMNVVRDYLHDLKESGSRHIATGGTDGSLVYSKIYRAGRIKLIVDIFGDAVKAWHGLVVSGVNDVSPGVRDDMIEAAKCRCLSTAMDRTEAYLCKVGSGCGDLDDKAALWQQSHPSDQRLMPAIRDMLGEVSYGDLKEAAADCAAKYISKAQPDKGTCRALRDSIWDHIKRMASVLNGI